MRNCIDRYVILYIMFKLEILDVSTLDNVAEMRKTLRQLRKVEDNASFVRPKYPFSCDEDLQALEAKFTGIKALIENFSCLPKPPDYSKISNKYAYLNQSFGMLHSHH